MIHPAAFRLMPSASGANDLIEGPFLGGLHANHPPRESVP